MTGSGDPGSRRVPERRWIATGAALVALVVAGAAPTAAGWSDAQAVPGTVIHAGSIDLRVDGVDGITDSTALDLTELVPGQSAATILTLDNAGTVPLAWTASTSGSNLGSGLVGALHLLVTDASSAAGGACGGTQLAGSTTSAGGPLVTTARTLAAGGSEQVCVQVDLPAGASGTLASKSTDLTISLQGANGGWSDTADIDGVNLATVSMVPPTVTCSGLLGVNLTMNWTEVPGATEYRVLDALGNLLQTIPAGGVLQASIGALTGATVEAVFGSSWVSVGAGC